MKTTFLANCCNADNCLQYTYPNYTPKQITINEIGPVTWCYKQNKLVFLHPFSTEDWNILQALYSRPDIMIRVGQVLDDETVLIHEKG